jgi:F-box protein 21
LLVGVGLNENRVADKSVHYVAAENVLAAGKDMVPTQPMLRIAGRYFKRWDEGMHAFVSNVRDEYPED